MDKSPLVNTNIIEGEKLVLALDARQFKIDAAMWLLSANTSDWSLWIASKFVDRHGPAKAYKLILSTIKGEGIQLPADAITVVSPSALLIHAIQGAIRTGPGISSIRLTANIINGIFIEDCYIYRS